MIPKKTYSFFLNHYNTNYLDVINGGYIQDPYFIDSHPEKFFSKSMLLDDYFQPEIVENAIKIDKKTKAEYEEKQTAEIKQAMEVANQRLQNEGIAEEHNINAELLNTIAGINKQYQSVIDELAQKLSRTTRGDPSIDYNGLIIYQSELEHDQNLELSSHFQLLISYLLLQDSEKILSLDKDLREHCEIILQNKISSPKDKINFSELLKDVFLTGQSTKQLHPEHEKMLLEWFPQKDWSPEFLNIIQNFVESVALESERKTDSRQHVTAEVEEKDAEDYSLLSVSNYDEMINTLLTAESLVQEEIEMLFEGTKEHIDNEKDPDVKKFLRESREMEHQRLTLKKEELEKAIDLGKILSNDIKTADLEIIALKQLIEGNLDSLSNEDCHRCFKKIEELTEKRTTDLEQIREVFNNMQPILSKVLDSKSTHMSRNMNMR